MISTAPIESFGELVERFPGIERLDPAAVGRFVFHAAATLQLSSQKETQQ